MHEQPIAEALLSTVLERAQEANASKVRGIYVVNGRLSGAHSDSVEFYLSFLSKGTIAEGAGVFFTQTSSQVRCRNCNTVYEPDGLDLTCPNCQERKVEIISGRELYIDSVEVE